MIKRMLVTDAPTIERSIPTTTQNINPTSTTSSSSRPSSIKSDRRMS